MKKENQKLYQAIETYQKKEKKHIKQATIYFSIFLTIVTLLGYSVTKLTIPSTITNNELLIYTIVKVTLIIISLILANKTLAQAMKNLNLKEHFNDKKTSILSYLSLKENQTGLQHKHEEAIFEQKLLNS